MSKEETPKPPPQRGHIHLRTTMTRKSAYVRAAKPRKLSEWIVKNLDQAASYQPTPEDDQC